MCHLSRCSVFTDDDTEDIKSIGEVYIIHAYVGVCGSYDTHDFFVIYRIFRQSSCHTTSCLHFGDDEVFAIVGDDVQL